MSMNVYMSFVLLGCGWTSMAVPISSRAAETIERTVEGTVVATDVTVDPQTIVVEVTLPTQEALVVGARVPTDTKIKRGKQDVHLADVKVGEKADITYLKTSDGLIARSVHVR
jgi:DNA-binding transcriptional regulator YdaS (Cro superfamily)